MKKNNLTDRILRNYLNGICVFKLNSIFKENGSIYVKVVCCTRAKQQIALKKPNSTMHFPWKIFSFFSEIHFQIWLVFQLEEDRLFFSLRFLHLVFAATLTTVHSCNYANDEIWRCTLIKESNSSVCKTHISMVNFVHF